MKSTLFVVAATLLTACHSLHSDDPSSLAFSIPKGSTLSLEKSIEIPEGKRFAVLQSGKLTTSRNKDLYDLNCNFELEKPGPRIIKPEVFTIRRAVDEKERISRVTIHYYTEVYLESAKGTDVNMLVCQEFSDWSDHHFTVSEMEKALGEYFSFKFVERK